MPRHVVIIGAGAVGAISAVEALREGNRVTIVEPGEPGGEQAASYGNAGWFSSHSVIPPAEWVLSLTHNLPQVTDRSAW